MKNLILLTAVLCCFYIYIQDAYAVIEVKDYRSLLDKIAIEEVTNEEVKLGVNQLTLQFCKDELFQSAGGTTSSSCMEKYYAFKSICENDYFRNKHKIYSEKSQIIDIAQRYTTCVGTY